MTEGKDVEFDEWRQSLRELLNRLPADYGHRHKAMRSLSTAFLEELGQAIQPALRDEMTRLESMTLQERRHWASACNEDLRNLHLALRCPQTGKPATLIVDVKDIEGHCWRYRLQIHEQGKWRRTYTNKEPPELVVIPDDGRIESLAHLGRPRGHGPAR